jgi:DNA recombination protein RmuC
MVDAECDDPEERNGLHLDFVRAVRKHVDDLGAKGYQDNTKLSAHEFVLMFVPIEGALALAMRDDDGLFQYAWERRVAIVGPTSLLMTLKVVSAIWRYQRQGENASQIAQRAGLIYDKLVGVVEALNTAGTKLADAKISFDTALGRLATGQGNALSQARQLEAMGVKPKKVMPKINVGGEEVEVMVEDADELPGSATSDALPAA